MSRTAVILLAAGSGTRMAGAVTDKVLAPLGGRPVFARSAAAFIESTVADLYVVVYRDQRQMMELSAYAPTPSLLVAGGRERQDSVMNALAALPPAHRLQTLARVHVGLRTGFCGALTTWASWNQTMVGRIVRGDWARGLIGYVVGAEVAASSLVLGHHAAIAMHHWSHARGQPACTTASMRDGDASMLGTNVDVTVGEPPPPPVLSRPEASAWWAEDTVCALLLVASVAGCVATVAAAAPAASSRSICLAALCGPFGVVLRWYLGTLNAAWSRAPWLPVGKIGRAHV